MGFNPVWWGKPENDNENFDSILRAQYHIFLIFLPMTKYSQDTSIFLRLSRNGDLLGLVRVIPYDY